MSYVPRHLGKVNDEGQLVLADPVAWRGALARHRGRSVWLTVKRQQEGRTMSQNRYYWSVVVAEIAAFIGETSEDTHELLKAQFLPGRDIELLDGQTLKMPPTTTRLSIEQMTEYIETVRRWAASFLGLSIPDAGQVEEKL